ncbi:hypothetical protein ACWDTP_34975 [Mycobacterium sp. NPDC003449]
MKPDLQAVRDAVPRLWRSRLGRARTSTVVLVIVFVALSWVQNTYAPESTPAETPGQVVPPGFVPDPGYTWVPRTNVQRTPTTTPTTTTTTPETTTSTPETTTTTPETTESGTSEESTSPATTSSSVPAEPRVIDPDGPGLLPPITLPPLPGAAPQPPAEESQPVPAPAALDPAR